MELTTNRPADPTTTTAVPSRLVARSVAGVLLAISATGVPHEPPSRPDVGRPTTCCRLHGPAPVSRADRTPPVAVTSPDGDRETRESVPDVVAGHVGGTAARFFTADGTQVVGDVFLLMASSGSSARARLYDRNPYTHDYGAHPDTVASNLLAAQTVATITGADIDVLELTAAPGGGPSGGITRAIVYLNVLSDGAFTGDLRVAATGRLGSEGHVGSIDHIDLKTAAAHFAAAEVLFTPTLPTDEVGERYGARTVGEIARNEGAAAMLHDARRVDEFRRWGANRPDGMDIVDARHLIDVAAYLCGAGSTYACDVTDLLDRHAQQQFERVASEARPEAERLRAVRRRAASADDHSG